MEDVSQCFLIFKIKVTYFYSVPESVFENCALWQPVVSNDLLLSSWPPDVHCFNMFLLSSRFISGWRCHFPQKGSALLKMKFQVCFIHQRSQKHVFSNTLSKCFNLKAYMEMDVCTELV